MSSICVEAEKSARALQSPPPLSQLRKGTQHSRGEKSLSPPHLSWNKEGEVFHTPLLKEKKREGNRMAVARCTRLRLDCVSPLRFWRQPCVKGVSGPPHSDCCVKPTADCLRSPFQLRRRSCFSTTAFHIGIFYSPPPGFLQPKPNLGSGMVLVKGRGTQKEHPNRTVFLDTDPSPTSIPVLGKSSKTERDPKVSHSFPGAGKGTSGDAAPQEPLRKMPRHFLRTKVPLFSLGPGQLSQGKRVSSL